MTRSMEKVDPRSMKTMPLSPGQSSIWLAQMLDPADPCYNIGECVEIAGDIDAGKFELALRQVVAASDALHLRFIETEAGPSQFFEHDADWQLIHLDFSGAADPEKDQSYMLAPLDPRLLDRIEFPLGGQDKAATRAEAAR